MCLRDLFRASRWSITIWQLKVSQVEKVGRSIRQYLPKSMSATARVSKKFLKLSSKADEQSESIQVSLSCLKTNLEMLCALAPSCEAC